jgi:hypothetical protein
MEYVRAVEKNAAYQDQLEKRFRNAIAQFEHILDLLEYYRHGSDKRVREAADPILESNLPGRLEPSEAPELVPEDDGTES